MTLVVFARFFSVEGRTPDSPICNIQPGHGGIDRFLAIAISALGYFLFFPIIFTIARLMTPESKSAQDENALAKATADRVVVMRYGPPPMKASEVECTRYEWALPDGLQAGGSFEAWVGTEECGHAVIVTLPAVRWWGGVFCCVLRWLLWLQ